MTIVIALIIGLAVGLWCSFFILGSYFKIGELLEDRKNPLEES